MFAGHIGVALALGRAERRINPGVMLFFALLLDVVLWLLVLLGWESVVVPADFASTHQPEYVFPYSHSLLAAVAWSALAGAAVMLGYPQLKTAKWRAAGIVGGTVFSHWLLDALVHVAGLPVLGEGSLKVGLGLWHQMPVALTLEALITAAGLWLFLAGTPLSRVRKTGLTVLTISLLVFTVLGMTVAPPPPSVPAMAGSSLAIIIVACLLAGWLGKRVA